MQDDASIVRGIYEAACGERSWDDLLTELCAVFDASSCQLFTPDVPLTDADSLVIYQGLPQSVLHAYLAECQTVDLWYHAMLRRYGHLGTGFTYVTDGLVEDRTLKRSRFFADYLIGMDIGFTVGTIITDGKGNDGLTRHALNIYRPVGWKPFDADEVRRFEALQGHLRRAMLLRKRLQLATHASMALDRAAAPVVVLSADRRILLANPAAERLLAASSRPLVEFGCLRAIDAQQTAALESAVKAATALAIDKRTGGVVRLSGPVGKGIVARVVPPPSNLPKRQLAAAVVFLSRESSTLLDPADMMAVLYRLSPAETALVRALCEGSTPEEYSAQRAVTMATIKTQLQSVFHKTNVRRQTDLIRLANSIAH